jgi:hypothetical protein
MTSEETFSAFQNFLQPDAPFHRIPSIFSLEMLQKLASGRRSCTSLGITAAKDSSLAVESGQWARQS